VQPVPSTSVVIVVHSPIALPELGERVRVVIVESGETGIVRCDVSACRDIDEVTLDVLARLQLVARRLGTSVQLDNAGARLLDLLALVGLSDVLPAPEPRAPEPVAPGPEPVERLRLDADRQTEQREQVLVDEEVEGRDPPV
jgi:ABC-type transporter Mla MlaB component